jgi:tetratricopeptide (TPR) repeat protein
MTVSTASSSSIHSIHSQGLVSQRVELYESPTRETKPVKVTKGILKNKLGRVKTTLSPQNDLTPLTKPVVVEERDDNVAVQRSPTPIPHLPENNAATHLVETGVYHYFESDFEKSLKAFHTALNTQRANVIEDDLQVANTLSNLGPTYIKKGNFKEAESVLNEALSLKRRLAPALSCAEILNNLGVCANVRGDLDESLRCYQEALVDVRKHDGSRKDIADFLFNIGRLEVQKKDWKNAHRNLDETYKLSKEVYGETHIFVAHTLELIGLVAISIEDYDDAMVSFTSALSIFRQNFGPCHADVANALFNVGMIREVRNELSDSWEAFSTARDLYNKLGTNKDDPRLQELRRSIANVEKRISSQNKLRSQVDDGILATNTPHQAPTHIPLLSSSDRCTSMCF